LQHHSSKHHFQQTQQSILRLIIIMRASTILAAASALTSQVAFAREIVLGTLHSDGLNNGFQISWFSGDDPCHTATRIIAGENENPCGERFSHGGFAKLHYEGCGGNGVYV
jgi:hypothetical protein